MLDGLDIDPYTVLGLERGASAEDVREAFHRKSKKHHPDLGGDDWAFRIVVRAHEVLAQQVDRDRLSANRIAPDTGRIRAGVHDKNLDPGRVVEVEVVWMRYEVDDFVALLADKGEERNLSGSLAITWPSADLAERAEKLPNAELILRALNATFDELRLRTQATGATSRIEGGRFTAGLGYPSGQEAGQAFKLFHVGLKARGLGVKQWTRDVTIPRDEPA